MYSMKRLLVIMELNDDHDDVVCKYVDRLCDIQSFESITFLHVASNIEMPKEISEKYPQLITPIDESIKDAILLKVQGYDNITKQKNISVKVESGVKLKTISHFIREDDSDLLVLSRGSAKKAQISLLKKIVRNAACAISIIPSSIPDIIRTILVPLDFSANSFRALDHARSLASRWDNINILGLHIYKVPQGYRKVGLKYDEFAEEMKKSIEHDYAAFLKEHDVNENELTMHYLLKKGNEAPNLINQFSFSNHVDMIVVGSRGHNVLSSFVLGSTTEGLISEDKYVPLTVVKNKGKSIRLWNTLLEEL